LLSETGFLGEEEVVVLLETFSEEEISLEELLELAGDEDETFVPHDVRPANKEMTTRKLYLEFIDSLFLLTFKHRKSLDIIAISLVY